MLLKGAKTRRLFRKTIGSIDSFTLNENNFRFLRVTVHYGLWEKNIKLSTIGCILPIGYSVLLPWIQTSLSEKPEIVFNKSKRSIWAYSLAKKKKKKKKKRRRVFALFKSIFLRNLCLSNARWFYGEIRKNGKGNMYVTENRYSRNEMWCATDHHNFVCHICTKGF